MSSFMSSFPLISGLISQALSSLRDTASCSTLEVYAADLSNASSAGEIVILGESSSLSLWRDRPKGSPATKDNRVATLHSSLVLRIANPNFTFVSRQGSQVS